MGISIEKVGSPRADLSAIKEHILLDVVDLIELSHVYDGEGNITLDQVIFWERVELDKVGHYKVIDWRMMPRSYREKLTDKEFIDKNNAFRKEYTKKHPNVDFIPRYCPKWLGGPMCPRKNHRTNMYEMVFYDTKDRTTRKIIAPVYRETWKQYDPEVQNREIFKQTTRRRLMYLGRYKDFRVGTGGSMLPKHLDNNGRILVPVAR
jgi:hypothetical protein